MIERVTIANHRDDPMFPRVERAVAKVLVNGRVVAPVDVLVKMNVLTPKDVEDWRFGRVPYLERVVRGSLSRLGRLLRILGYHCHDLNLVASPTTYVKWGKGARGPRRFTKTGEPRLEKVYARHFVWPGKGPFRWPEDRSSNLVRARTHEAPTGNAIRRAERGAERAPAERACPIDTSLR